MKNYKIKVNGTHPLEYQDILDVASELGYDNEDWGNLYNLNYLFLNDDGSVGFSLNGESVSDEHQELTLPQIRDLVGQSKSKVREYLDPADHYKLCLINPSDAAHWMIEVPDEAELYVYWPHDKDYHFQSGQGFYEDGGWNLCSFSVEEIKKGEAGAEILWSREPIQEQGLISGADALRALADGVKPCEIEGKFTTGLNSMFVSMDGKVEIFVKYLDDTVFRIKPRTININSKEYPKPLTVVWNNMTRTAVKLDFNSEDDAKRFAEMFNNEFIYYV